MIDQSVDLSSQLDYLRGAIWLGHFYPFGIILTWTVRTDGRAPIWWPQMRVDQSNRSDPSHNMWLLTSYFVINVSINLSLKNFPNFGQCTFTHRLKQTLSFMDTKQRLCRSTNCNSKLHVLFHNINYKSGIALGHLGVKGQCGFKNWRVKFMIWIHFHLYKPFHFFDRSLE